MSFLPWIRYSVFCFLLRGETTMLFPNQNPNLFQSRGTWHTIRDHVQRSYLIVWDTEPDQLCVPASISTGYGDRLSQVPACRIFLLYGSRNLNYCWLRQMEQLFILWLFIYWVLSCIRTWWTSEQGRRKYFSLKITLSQPNFPVRFTGLFLHVRCIPQQKFAMMFLSKCVIPAVYVKLAGTLRGKPFQANNWQ